MARQLQKQLMQNMMNKVPAVTVAFWVAKTFATTVGETAADYLKEPLNKLAFEFSIGLSVDFEDMSVQPSA